MAQDLPRTGLAYRWEKVVVTIEKFVKVKEQWHTEPHGTGFFVVDTSAIIKTYLVTNRHILKGRDSVLLKFYAGKQEMAKAVLLLRDSMGAPTWKSHPDTLVDVAAIEVNLDVGMGALDFPRFRDSHGLEIGEELFFYGFPLNITTRWGQLSGPVLRHGFLSYITSEPTFIGSEIVPKDVLLIDGFSFGGNSGSPVVTRISPTNPKAKLVGIIYGHVRAPKEFVIPKKMINGSFQNAPIKFEIPEDTIQIFEHTGLSKAFPAERIRETLEMLHTK